MFHCRVFALAYSGGTQRPGLLPAWRLGRTARGKVVPVGGVPLSGHYLTAIFHKAF